MSFNNVTFNCFKESSQKLRVRTISQCYRNCAWEHSLNSWSYIWDSNVLKEVEGWDINTITLLKYKIIVSINVLEVLMLLKVWFEKADWALIRWKSQSLNSCLCLWVSNDLSLTRINLLSEKIWDKPNFQVSINSTLYLFIWDVFRLILECLALFNIST